MGLVGATLLLLGAEGGGEALYQVGGGVWSFDFKADGGVEKKRPSGNKSVHGGANYEAAY